MLAAMQTKHWQAGLDLGFQLVNGKTLLAHRKRYGPLAVQRPFYPEADVCHVYLLHPPGGVVGGDQLAINVQVATAANALITTPGATKFYRSLGDTAVQKQTLQVAQDGCLEWFPQENIFFPSSHVALTTEVNIAGNGRLAMWEINCFGRSTLPERFDTGFVDLQLSIQRDHQPYFIERLRVDSQRMASYSSLRDLPVNATFLMNHVNPNQLAAVRDLMTTLATTNGAATLLDDLLVVRYLSDCTEMARNLFIAVWQLLRPDVLQKKPYTPRIWNT